MSEPQYRFNCLWACGVAALLLTISASAHGAFGGQIRTFTTQARAWDVTDSQPNVDTGFVVADNLSMAPINLHAISANTDAYFDASASVQLGVSPLRVYAEYTADSHSTIDSGCSAGGDVRASMQNTITITHDTLPDGSAVDFVTTLDVTGDFDVDKSGNAVPNGFFTADWWVGSEWLHLQRDKDNIPGLPWSESRTLSVLVGQTYIVSGGLRANVGGDAISGGMSHVNIDLSQTMNVTIVPLTAGADYTTESGASYNPIPAPAAALPMSTWMVWAMCRRRRGHC